MARAVDPCDVADIFFVIRVNADLATALVPVGLWGCKHNDCSLPATMPEIQEARAGVANDSARIKEGAGYCNDSANMPRTIDEQQTYHYDSFDFRHDGVRLCVTSGSDYRFARR